MRPKKEKGHNVYSIRAVQRVCDILDLIQGNPEGFSLTYAADEAKFPKSSAYRYLTTLEERKYLVRDQDTGIYRMGPAFVPLQSRQMTVLADRIRPHLTKLRDEFQETANLGVLDGYRISYVDIIESPNSVRLAPRKGDREYLHCTALGKAIASTLDHERIRGILESDGMPERTPKTITSMDSYFDEIAKVRHQGYAVDDCENDMDGRCVAIPLHHLGLPAAISMAAPASRLPVEDVPKVAKALTDCALNVTNGEEGASKRQ